MCRSRRISRTASIRIWSPSGSSTYRSGWVRRPTRGSPESSSEANASAVACLPTPAGPWKRYACAGPSASAAARRRLASPCSGMLSNTLEDLLCDLAGRPRPVDRHDPPREGCRELPVGLGDPSAEGVVLALDPVAGLAQPPRRPLGIEQQQKGAVGKDPADRVDVQLEHPLHAEPARDPLIGERRVEVAVAHDVGASREAWSDHLL